MRILILALVLLGLGCRVAPAASPAAPPAAALTPSQAQHVLDVLNDPKQRAAFTATLTDLAHAAAIAAPAKPATLPLAPDSLGEQVLIEGSAWLAGASGQIAGLGRAVGNLPAVVSFTRQTLTDPGRRMHVLDVLWRLALVLAVAWAVEFGLARLLRRPIAALAAYAPNGSGEPAPGLEAAEAGETEHQARRHRFARTWRALRRLPFVLLRCLLDLLPLAAFIAVAVGGAELATRRPREVLLTAMTAYAACRLLTAAARLLASPDEPRLRLVHLTDHGAAYVVVWVRRLAGVAALGWALADIGSQFGLEAPASQAVLKFAALVDHIFLIIIVLQCRGSVAAWIRGPGDPTTLTARFRNRLAALWHFIAIFYIVALWLVWAAEVQNGYARVWHLFLVTCGVLIAARVLGVILLGGLDRGFRVSPDLANRFPGLEQRANRYYPVLRFLLGAALALITGLALLFAWGVNTLAWFRADALGGRALSAMLTVAVAALVATLVWEAVNTWMDRHLARLTREAQLVRSARLRTLLPILRTVLLIALLAIFALTALSEIGVNIAPLLAGAGILGVAIGFGSQKLVQDFITGIFLLLENAMQVGDWVTVAGLSGSVENLSIRTMRLRAGDGSVHIIPFSSVSTVTNVNRGIGNAAVSVSVMLAEDTDRVAAALADIASGMREEPQFSGMMRSGLQLWGVDQVGGGTATITGQIVCTDSGRWAVQREFNRRLNIRFKEMGVRMATPVQTIHMAEAHPPAAPEAGREDAPPPDNQVAQSPPPAALGNTQ